MIIVMSGPSGVGKTTLARKLVEINPALRLVVTCTTRAPKNGELNGIDYHFKGKKEFEESVSREEFAEWAEVHGNFYGTLESDIHSQLDPHRSDDVLLTIDVQGMRKIKEKFPNVVSIFILPLDFIGLELRIRNRNRGETEEEIAQRLASAHKEIANMDDFDYQVVNGNVLTTARDIMEVVSIVRSSPRPVRV